MGEESRRQGVWVSQLNTRPEIWSRFDRQSPVQFYDTTLRDGEQTVGVVLDPDQKLEIARQLDRLGVGRIEAGFPRVSSQDSEAFRRILHANLEAEVWGFSRAVKGDLDELIRLGVGAAIVEVPTSRIKLEAYGLTRKEVLKRAVEALRYAGEHGIQTAFFPVDGTRTELAYLREIYQAAVDAGAAELVVVDTIGACGPEAVEFLVSQVREWVGASIPLHFHGHNDFGLGTASAIAAVRAGALWIHGTINGMGERAGNADLGEVAMALHALYDVPISLDLTRIREVSRAVREKAAYSVEAWKPVVGDNLFVRESGAVASQFHIPQAIEPFSAHIVGARRAIVLGKKSGLASLQLKCRELGLEMDQSRRARVLAEVKRQAIRKRGLLTDAEFREILKTSAAWPPD
ncbi:MAG: LeuA family protein [Acidobacteriota bacterium]